MTQGTYLFSHGKTSLVVEIITQSDETAECRIVRRLDRVPRDRDQRQAFARWLHTQPKHGDLITLPLACLRPCPPLVRLAKQRDPQRHGLRLLLAGACLLTLVAVAPGTLQRDHLTPAQRTLVAGSEYSRIQAQLREFDEICEYYRSQGWDVAEAEMDYPELAEIARKYADD